MRRKNESSRSRSEKLDGPFDADVTFAVAQIRELKIRDVPALQKFLLESGRLFDKKECNAYFKHHGHAVHKR